MPTGQTRALEFFIPGTRKATTPLKSGGTLIFYGVINIRGRRRQGIDNSNYPPQQPFKKNSRFSGDTTGPGQCKAKTRRLLCSGIASSVLGGADGTRTRDLRRDRPAL